MKRVLMTPQVSDSRIAYSWVGEVLTATIEGQSDTWDFSGLPDGEAEDIESDLPVCPVISARRVAGVLEVVLLNWIGEGASESEAYPEWQEVA